MTDDALEQLAKLREPFPDNLISKLPRQTFKGGWDGKRKSRCQECGGWHPSENTIHLSYVGHAALTSRMLDVDPLWFYTPLALTDEGLPAFDKSGGLWIKLTICGVTRIGYGHAPSKSNPGDREKEVIGDALRNAAMRFGAALDLWHKGELHVDHDDAPEPVKKKAAKRASTTSIDERDGHEDTDYKIVPYVGTSEQALADIWQTKNMVEWTKLGQTIKANTGFSADEKKQLREAMAERKVELLRNP